jgi:pimeloyl-ACP methyl ester carboxylesterase
VKLEILHCKAAGSPPPDRPPLLFIHGSFCGAWVWAEHFLPHFARAGYDCEAVSLRGHGASEGHEQLADASLNDFLEDAEAAFDQMAAPPIVVGHSMGGAIAQYLAARRPAAGLILLGSVPPSGLAATALHMSAVTHDLMWQIAMLQTLGPQSVDAYAVQRALFAPGTPASLGRAYLPRLQDESRRISLDLMGWLRPPLPRPLPPVLVAGGDGDAFVPVSALRETAAYWSGDLALLPGIPHGLMLDPSWTAVAEAMLEWLRRRYP